MKLPRAVLLLAVYSVVAVLFAAGLLATDLPDQCLVLLLAPIMAASVNNRRIVYLPMVGVFVAVAVWVAYDRAIFLHESLATVLAAFLSAVATCEAVAWQAKRRRGAEDALRKSERRYRELFENANDIAYTMDLEGRFISLNKAGERITGYTRAEVLGVDVVQFMPPDYRRLPREMIDRKLSGLDTTQYEVEILAKDGHPVPLEVSTRLIYEDGKATAVQGIARDISERKQAQAETARLAAAVEHAAESIVITDAGGTIQYVNPAFEGIAGYRREEVVGKNPRILKSGKQDRAFYKQMWNTIRGGGIWSGKLTNKKKDGTLYEEEVTISPIYDSAGRLTNYVAVKRDITQERALESQLRHVQKMEAVGQLAGGIAHDFNNLLQAIQGYASLAMKDLPPDGKASRRTAEIISAVDRGAALVRKLLTFSRREEIHPINLDLNRVIGGMMEMLRRIIGEDIELNVAPGHDLKAVFADPVQIEQILLNLCANARDAMPDGGRITIETRNVALDRAFCLRHPWSIEGDYVLVGVSDSGPGIPAEIREHIFEPFFTTKEVDKGTGLGLATVYGVVKQHKGLIHVYSEPGEGSVFKIYLPATDSGADADKREQEVPAPGGTETILVAEDEERVCEVAVQILEGAGYRVIVARDGEQAIQAIEQHGDAIALALLDVVMPRMGGRAVYDRIKALRPKMPVLFNSGYGFSALRTGMLPGEQPQLIQKPYKSNDLLLKIRQLLDAAK